jgi:thiosulfate dehydrogenase (quinone) large subunit
LRATLGLNILVHGLGRLPKFAAFASSTVTQFSATPLPAWSVRVYATSLPFAATMAGLLLLLGLCSRWMLIAGAMVITSLVFGIALSEDWNTLAIQMLYGLDLLRTAPRPPERSLVSRSAARFAALLGYFKGPRASS